MPARCAASKGHGRGVAEQGRDMLVPQPLGFLVQPRHGLGMHPRGQLQGGRAIGRCAVSRRVDRAGVGDVGGQLGRAYQSLAPVGKQVGMGSDDDRQVRWNLVDHRDGPVEMAKAMTGNVKGELLAGQARAGVSIQHDETILTIPRGLATLPEPDGWLGITKGMSWDRFQSCRQSRASTVRRQAPQKNKDTIVQEDKNDKIGILYHDREGRSHQAISVMVRAAGGPAGWSRQLRRGSEDRQG